MAEPPLDHDGAAPQSVFVGGGEMAALMAVYDWSASPLGPTADLAAEPADRRPHHADLALRDVDGLGARPHLLLQRRLPADRSASSALGAGLALATRSGRKSGPTSGRASRPCCERGEATWDEGLLLFLERSGYPEETYHTFSYSPLARRRRHDRRHALRGHRGDRARHRRAPAGARCAIWRARAVDRADRARCLRSDRAQRSAANGRDLPFTLIYLFEPRTAVGAPGRARPASPPATPPRRQLDRSTTPARPGRAAELMRPPAAGAPSTICPALRVAADRRLARAAASGAARARSRSRARTAPAGISGRRR